MRNLAPQHQALHHLRTAQIKVAVFQTQFFRSINVIHDFKRHWLGLGQNAGFFNFNLDLARLHVRVDFLTSPHQAMRFNNVLVPYLVGDLKCRWINLFIKNQLHDARAIPQVDKDQATQIASLGNPAFYDDFLANLLFAGLTSIIGTLHFLLPLCLFLINGFKIGKNAVQR